MLLYSMVRYANVLQERKKVDVSNQKSLAAKVLCIGYSLTCNEMGNFYHQLFELF